MGYIFSTFGRMTAKEARQCVRDELRSELSEKSLVSWAWALDLHPVAAGASGFMPRCTEDEFEEMEREAAQALAEQGGRARAAQAWFAAQIRAGRKVTTQELAARLGADDEATARAMLEAWAFDLFHLHRQLWRELKRLEAQEAGLNIEEAETAVKREERRLKRLGARPTVRPAPVRLKRPRPIEQRPQLQPNAPTN